MAEKIITLYIDDTSLRLLVAEGKKVRKWADLPLEPGLVKDGAIVDEAGVATKIEELLKAQEVKTKKVVVGLSGLNCLSRPITLPQLPKAMLAEAVKREAGQALPITQEQFHISWQIISSTKEELQVFLVALPRKTADALFKTLHLAGLDPYLADIKPLALARMVNRPTAIIVDVQPTEFDIVIMVDAIPQPIRTLSLPSKAQSLQKKIPIIREELDRTIKFYNSTHSEKPLESSVPIFVSGELAQEPQASQSLVTGLGYPELLLIPHMECPVEMAQSRYMVNIALASKKLPSKKVDGFSIVNVNVLPGVYQPKPRSLAQVLIAPGVILAVGLLAYLMVLTQGTVAETASLQAQLDATNQLLIERQLLKRDIAQLEKETEEVEALRDTLNAVRNIFATQHVEINHDLEVTTSNLPETIDLSGITYASGGLTVSGMSPDREEVLQYASDLRTHGLFSEVIISTMKSTEDGIEFTLALKHKE